jgi:chitodextrinase
VVDFAAEDDNLPVDARQHDPTHSWTFGDGGTSNKGSGRHTYAAAGTYDLTLEERLWDGSVARKTVQLAVPPPEC